MSPRTTGILLVVAAALGAFVWLWGVRGAEERREAEAREKRLFPEVEAEEIRAIELRTVGEGAEAEGVDARVERRDGRWRVVTPVDFPGDEAAVDNLASTLAQMQSESVIEEPQPPAVYGLGEDARVVRFFVDGEEEPRALRIGGKTPVGASSYVSTQRGDAVYVVPTWRTNAFRKDLGALRESRVVRFDSERVTGIEADWPGGGATLEKRDGAWRVVAPVEDEADAGTVNDFLSDLAFLRAEGFVDAPAPEDEAALAKPAFEVTLRLAPPDEGAEDGDADAAEDGGGEDDPAPAAEGPRTVTFTLGESRDGTQRLARGSGEDALYLVPAERIGDFPRSLDAWRFKELARFDVTEAERFELVFHPEAGAEPVVVRGLRTETGWETEPEALAPGRASRLVAELARLEAESIEADAMGREQLAGLGLVPPRVAVRVYGAADPEAEGRPTPLAAVDLGELAPERGIAARRGDRPTVFRAPSELAEHVPVTLEAFRNRFTAKERDAEEQALQEEFQEFLETPPEEPEAPAP